MKREQARSGDSRRLKKVAVYLIRIDPQLFLTALYVSLCVEMCAEYFDIMAYVSALMFFSLAFY